MSTRIYLDNFTRMSVGFDWSGQHSLRDFLKLCQE